MIVMQIESKRCISSIRDRTMNSTQSTEAKTVLDFDNAAEAKSMMGVNFANLHAECLHRAAIAGHPVNLDVPHDVWIKVEADGNAQVVITQPVGSQANGSS